MALKERPPVTGGQRSRPRARTARRFPLPLGLALTAFVFAVAAAIEGSEAGVSFWELQLYSMRHVQEHAAQLSLFLGQHAIPDEALDWVPWAKGEPGS